MSGYTRQAAANISAGLTISAADLNAEYNQIQTAFDGTSGHTHTGGSGNAPKIPLTTSVSGILPVANGGTGISTVFTAGSVIFSNGSTYAQDNAAFFWDNTNNYLGIGIAVPVAPLHVHSATTSTRIHLSNSASGTTVTDGLALQLDSTVGYIWAYENVPLLIATNNLERMRVQAGGNVCIGNANDTYKLDITGDLNISGTYRIGGTALAAANLSNGVTGTGAVMLAASPTTTGTLTAAAITASGNGSFGGTLSVTGGASADSLILSTDLQIAHGGTGASSAANAFANIVISASSLAADGYITLVNGLKIQWGSETLVGVNTANVTFPSAFASALYTVIINHQQAAGVSLSSGTDNETTSGFTINLSGAYNGDIYWLAIGV